MQLLHVVQRKRPGCQRAGTSQPGEWVAGDNLRADLRDISAASRWKERRSHLRLHDRDVAPLQIELNEGSGGQSERRERRILQELKQQAVDLDRAQAGVDYRPDEAIYDAGQLGAALESANAKWRAEAG